MVKAANGIYAQAGETYRVQLLIGKTYTVVRWRGTGRIS